MEYKLCVDIYGAPFQTEKAAKSSEESAGNTQPFMERNWAIRQTQKPIQILRAVTQPAVGKPALIQAAHEREWSFHPSATIQWKSFHSLT